MEKFSEIISDGDKTVTWGPVLGPPNIAKETILLALKVHLHLGYNMLLNHLQISLAIHGSLKEERTNEYSDATDSDPDCDFFSAHSLLKIESWRLSCWRVLQDVVGINLPFMEKPASSPMRKLRRNRRSLRQRPISHSEKRCRLG
jgi:hypothetical protein